jgi:hypothetical protein
MWIFASFINDDNGLTAGLPLYTSQHKIPLLESFELGDSNDNDFPNANKNMILTALSRRAIPIDNIKLLLEF